MTLWHSLFVVACFFRDLEQWSRGVWRLKGVTNKCCFFSHHFTLEMIPLRDRRIFTLWWWSHSLHPMNSVWTTTDIFLYHSSRDRPHVLWPNVFRFCCFWLECVSQELIPQLNSNQSIWQQQLHPYNPHCKKSPLFGSPNMRPLFWVQLDWDNDNAGDILVALLP